MADTQLKQKVRDTLKHGYFSDPDDAVWTLDGEDDDSIHIVVVSRKLHNRRLMERTDLIWSALVDKLLPEEWGKISLSVGTSPVEIKSI